jgi:hypothetical protein
MRRGSIPPTLRPADAAIKVETRAAVVAIKGETNQREAEVVIKGATSLRAAAAKVETNLKPVVGKGSRGREVVTRLTLAAESMCLLVQDRRSPHVADSSQQSIARRRSVARTLANNPQRVRGSKRIRA